MVGTSEIGNTEVTGMCETCAMGLDHCHAVVIEHPDGSYECTDGCGGGLAVHDEVVGCAELGLGCCPGDGAGEGVAGGDQRPTPLAPAA